MNKNNFKKSIINTFKIMIKLAHYTCIMPVENYSTKVRTETLPIEILSRGTNNLFNVKTKLQFIKACHSYIISS